MKTSKPLLLISFDNKTAPQKNTHIIMSVGRFDDTIFSDQIDIKSNYGWSLVVYCEYFDGKYIEFGK